MATGVGMGFDLGELDKAIEKAEKGLDNLVKKSQTATDTITQHFKNVADNGVGALVSKLNEAKNVLSNLGVSTSKKTGISNIVDEVNKLTQSIEKAGASNGLEPINKAMESMMARITRLKNEIDTFKSFEGGNLLKTEDYAHIGRVSDELNKLMTKYVALGEAKKRLQSTDAAFDNRLDTIKGVSIEYQKQKSELDKLNDAYRSGTSELQKKAKAEDEATKEAIKAQKELQREQGKVAKQAAKTEKTQRSEYLNSPKGALEYARSLDSGVKSINTMNLALQRLKNAQNDIDRNAKGWRKEYQEIQKEIDKINKELGNAKNKHKGLLDTAGQLQRAFAAVFSVSSIKGYVNKLIAIRGEFEMQHRSLQVLLQNKDEANELWDKTVALAVKSPLTTKQLVTYTKQLAAYRIESDKLYETNRMLADVSQGLGVDMNRLILAFGQVKAANFLRGTELRQFSEAGVNMLDELAKRFTALEGRAVSVGEVFERVSKRMVSFQDVEAVFKSITSEGGIFYQMQEKQSETLKGQMLNLKDSYELMLNEIGKSQEGIIKGFISMIKSAVDNWRQLAPFINTAGVALTTYFGTGVLKGIYKYSLMIRDVWKAHPFLMVASAVATLTTLFVELNTMVGEFEAAITDVEKNTHEGLIESISLYNKLADTINDVTKSSEERNAAYDELLSKFDEILPDEYLEIKYIQDLATGYSEAEAAMQSYYNAKSIEQKKAAIGRVYDEDIYGTYIPDLAEQYKQEFEQRFDDTTARELSGHISAWLTKALDAVEKGDLEAGNIMEYVEEQMSKYLRYSVNTSMWGDNALDLFNNKMIKLVAAARGKQEALESMKGLPQGTIEEEQAAKKYNKMKAEVKMVEDYFSKLASLYDAYAKDNTKREAVAGDVELLWKQILSDATITKYIPALESAMNKLGAVAEKGGYEFTKALSEIKSDLLSGEGGLSDIVFEMSIDTTDAGRNLFVGLSNEIKNKGNKELRGAMQEAIVGSIDYVASHHKLDEASKQILAQFIPDSQAAQSTVRESVKSLMDRYEDEVKRWDKAKAKGVSKENLESQFQISEETISRYRNLGSVLKELYERLGGYDKNEGKGKDKELEKLNTQIKLVRALADDYDKLRKAHGKQHADENIWSQERQTAFKEADLDWKNFGVGNRTDEVKNLQSLNAQAAKSSKGMLVLGQNIAEAKNEINLFAQSLKDAEFARYFEDLFGNYELSIELEKLNIPRGLASKIFGFDPTTLSGIRKATLDKYGIGGLSSKTNADILGSKEYAALSDAARKQISDNLKKIDDQQLKSLVEYGKKYSKYLLQAQNERVKIKLDEIRQLEEIELLYQQNRIDADMKARMKMGVEKETEKALQNQEWKDFQDSDMYIRLFENLETASSRSIKTMKAKLLELRESLKKLAPANLKALNDQIEKLDELEVRKNPFKGMSSSIKDLLKDWRRLGGIQKQYKEALARQGSQQRVVNDDQMRVNMFERELDAAIKKYGVESEEAKLAKGKLITSQKDLLLNQEILNNISNRVDALGALINKINNTKKTLKESFTEIGNGISGVVSSMGDMATNLENAFGMSDKLKDAFGVIQGVGGGVADMFSGAANLMSGNPFQMIQGGMQAIGGIAKVFSAFNEVYDKKKERQIQKEIKLVECLGKLYDDLGEKIEKAYSIDTFATANQNAQENLEAQYAATQRMIEAEKDKKKTDWERIDEWQEQQEEILKQMKELEEQRLRDLGGVGGEDYYKEATQAFVDAWLDAFRETGDGLDALENKFEEMVLNIVRNQLVMKGATKLLEPLYRTIDEIVDDYDVTKDELQELDAESKTWLPKLDEWLESAYKVLGAEGVVGTTSELSGLSAGIQGVSEETADVIAAYLNSIRLFASENNLQITRLVDLQAANNEIVNPIAENLKNIAKNTQDIYNLLYQVIGTGKSMRVTLD